MSSGVVPILMYHEVAEPARVDALARKIQRSYISTVEEFEEQIRFLHTAGIETLSLSSLCEALATGAVLPDRAVVITFDDGYEGNFTHARRILRKYGATATFFVISNRIGDPFMMSWAQLKDLVDEGFEVQSHTANHPLLSTLGAHETHAELAESKAMIEAQLGQRCEFLSLPNGDSNEHLREHALACGYRGVCGSRFGFNGRDADRFFLNRIAIKGGLPLVRFQRIVRREPSLMRSMRLRAAIKSTVAAALGKARYDRIYNAFFGVDEQQQRRQP